MNVMISWLIVVMLAIAGIGTVLLGSGPLLERANSAAALSQAEQVMTQLSSAIETVGREGVGSSRMLEIPSLSGGTWQLFPEEDMAEFRLAASPLERLVRRFHDGLTYISGFDANCSLTTYGGSPAWLLENSYLKAYLQKASGVLDTSKNIFSIQSKATGAIITPADSSIIIDGDPATSSGTGWSEMRTGSNIPVCRAHFFVNASVSYDVYYTLYSGADFLTIDVRNIS